MNTVIDKFAVPFLLCAMLALAPQIQVLAASVEEAAPGLETPDPEPDDTADLDEAAELSLEEAEAVLARSAAIQALQDQAERIISEHGPYDYSLIETYSDLGRLYQQQNLFPEAIEVLGQALQLERIANGLYSERQLAVIQRLIEANEAAGSWQGVDDNHHLLFQIRSRLYHVSDPDYIASVVELGEWKTRATRENLLGQSMALRISENDQMRALYLATIDAAFGDSPAESASATGNQDQLVSLLYAKALADHDAARYLMQISPHNFQSNTSRYIEQVVCYHAHVDSAPQDGPVYPGGARMLLTAAESAAPAPPPQIVPRQRQCFVQQRPNPQYWQSKLDARRFALERAGSTLKQTLEVMQAALEQGGLEEELGRVHSERLAVLSQMHQNLVQEIRRDTFRQRF